MIECLGVPEDRIQTITEHKAENFIFDRDYLGLTGLRTASSSS